MFDGVVDVVTEGPACELEVDGGATYDKDAEGPALELEVVGGGVYA